MFKKILAGIGIAAAVGLVFVLKPLTNRPEDISDIEDQELEEEPEELSEQV